MAFDKALGFVKQPLRGGGTGETYQTLDPKPQIGKSLEASVEVVPRIPNSNSFGLGNFVSLCMTSYAEIHAISPQATWGPPLGKVYGLSAFLRIATIGA